MSGRSPRWINFPERMWESTFSQNTWEQVIWCCQNRFIPPAWAVGDQLQMEIDGDEYLVDIIGMYHDTYADGGLTAPLTFQLHTCYDGTCKMYATKPTLAAWADSDMRKTTLPGIMALMPTAVQAAIKPVLKQVGAASDSVADKLFLLSRAEYLSASESYYGTQYAYYAAGNTHIKTRRSSTTLRNHWTRDVDTSDGTKFYYIGTDGNISSKLASASTSMYEAFAFCF